MKDTLVRGYGIVNPVCDADSNKANAFPLLLDISGYVTSSGLSLPFCLMQRIVLLWEVILVKMAREMVRDFNLIVVEHLLICLALFLCLFACFGVSVLDWKFFCKTSSISFFFF